MNLNVLKSIMVLNGDNQKTLAKKAKFTEATISRKFSTQYDWQANEIKKIIDVYDLTPQQVYDIFFK